MRGWIVSILLVFSILTGADAQESYRRPADQTYLTYPEWFLVFSPEEYATFLRDHPSYDFPYFGHIAQFWKGYKTMYDQTVKHHYPFNTGYHVMVMVIGTSTTVEYTIKSLYGNTIGRLAALTQTHGRTSEQEYGAKVAQEYVDFIKKRPWYEFDFGEKLIGLYRQNDFFGPDFIRKCERKFALSAEYGIKYLYAKLIGFLTDIGYEAPSMKTRVVMHKDRHEKEIKFLPRYDAFKEHILAYAKSGYEFDEIAGNDAKTPILVSVVSSDKKSIETQQCLYTSAILSQPGYYRCLFEAKIGALGKRLREGGYEVYKAFLPPKHAMKLEHVFDY